MDTVLECRNDARPACGVDDSKEDVDEVVVGNVVDAGGVAEPKEIVRQGCE